MITFFGVICDYLSEAFSGGLRESNDPVNEAKQLNLTLIMNQALALSQFEYRQLLEKWYVLLKVDLNIPELFRQTRYQLIDHLTNPDIFHESFIAFFLEDSKSTEKNEPEQIVKIKTILKALYNLERQSVALLQTDMSRDSNIFLMNVELLFNLRDTANTAATELKVLNDISVDLEIILGSSINALMTKLIPLMNVINIQEIPSTLPNQIFSLLPELSSNPNQGLNTVSTLIYQLPDYLHELQSILDPNYLQHTTQSPELLKNKIEQLTKRLVALQNDQWWLTFWPTAVFTLTQLLEQVPTLLDASGQFNHASHEKLKQILQQLNDIHFPKIISELESIEEQLYLRPNLLITPVFKAMSDFSNGLGSLEKYWAVTSNQAKEQLDSQVQTTLNNVAVDLTLRAIGFQYPSMPTLTESPELNTLTGNTFIKAVRDHRAERWLNAKENVPSQEVLDAHTRFFKKVSEHFQSVTENRSWLNYLSGTKRGLPRELIVPLQADYAMFQPYYAKLYPELDQLFITDFSSWFDRFDPKQSVTDFFTQIQRQAELNCHMIEINSDMHDQLYQSNDDANPSLNFQQLTREPQKNSNVIEYKDSLMMVQSPLGEQRGFLSPIYRFLVAKPSENLDYFIGNTLKQWLKTHIDPTIYSQLTFDPDEMIRSVVIINKTVQADEIQSFKYTPSVFFYKKLLCSLAMIQKDIAQLERFYEQKVSYSQLLVKLLVDKDFWQNIRYASEFALDAIESPGLGELLQVVTSFLEPFRNVPILNNYVSLLKNNREVFDLRFNLRPQLSNDTNLIERWEQRQLLIKNTLNQEVDVPQDDIVIDSESPPAEMAPVDTRFKTLEDITAELYRLPQLIRNMNPVTTNQPVYDETFSIKNINALLATMHTLKLDQKTLQMILTSINEINETLTKPLANAAKEAKSLILTLENQLHTIFLLAADEIEFQLNTKPGILSQACEDALNHFLNDFLTNFPISTEDKLTLMEQHNACDQRIAKEKSRQLLTKQRCNKALQDMRRKINDGYEELALLNKPVEDFTREDLEIFLNAYKKLQPYLVKINADYELIFTLGNLQRPKDFKKYCKEINALKDKMLLLIEQQNLELNQLKHRFHDRMHYLNTEKKHHHHKLAEMKKRLQIHSLLNHAFQVGDLKLQQKNYIKPFNQQDPIINAFHFVVSWFAFETTSNMPEKIINFQEAFNKTRTIWNDNCINKIQNNALKMPMNKQLENVIIKESEQLYSEYADLIEAYTLLQQLREYINQHPSRPIEINQEKLFWIDTLQKELLQHEVSPKQRLINIATIGLSPSCKTALEQKGSQTFLEKLYQLYVLLFRFKTHENQLKTALQEKLVDINQGPKKISGNSSPAG